MEDDRITALMKYVRGEISFSEWIESGAGSADVEDENETQDGNGDDQGDGEAGGLQTTEVNTLSEERSQPTGVENVWLSEMDNTSRFTHIHQVSYHGLLISGCHSWHLPSLLHSSWKTYSFDKDPPVP